MRKSLIMIGLLTISSIMYAANVEYFVSAGGGKASITTTATVVNVGGITTNNDASTYSVYSLGGGILINDSHRIGLEYSNYNTTGNSSLNSIGIGYDYRIHISDSKFTPFIGASYVLLKYAEDLTNTSGLIWDESSINLNTNAIFGRVGVDYDINKIFYVSAMYDYTLITSGSNDIGLTVLGTSNTVNMEIAGLSRFQFLVGYKF